MELKLDSIGCSLLVVDKVLVLHKDCTEFFGTIIGFNSSSVIVEDSDGNVYHINPSDLKKVHDDSLL